MTFGRYGTALWLDNHTEEWWSGPSDRGQRLAGSVLHVHLGVRSSEQGTEPIVSKSSEASMVFDVQQDDAWTRIAMEEEAGRIAIGHTNGAITLLEY